MNNSIKFNNSDEDKVLKTLFEKFKELGKEGLYYDMYELAEYSDISDSEMWKAFLSDGRVASYIQTELNFINKAKAQKLLKDADKSKSVGQAQMISALNKSNEATDTKEGNVFIYTYVPLSEVQMNAENIEELSKDIFMKGSSEAALHETVASSILQYLASNKDKSIQEQLKDITNYLGGKYEGASYIK